ncbi:SH3 domain-containing protein [Umezawaea endophytica]|uniref:SH3 domain-containing protein n=1 Tax=Umezawaea endophytica TaxID=1654476 RepID=A0A9X3AHB4_9PSEU|nr:SH3 domain-containing protein [Umezawaea endophytica]MCS7481232.1 SH3 domain-containing protein [Umezawaea endophytica]
MRTTIKSLAAVAAIAVSALVSLAPSAVAEPDKPGAGVSVQAVCPNTNWRDADSRTDHSTGAANIRTGTGTNCTAVGQAQRGHLLDMHCYTEGDGGTWSHVRDTVTGKQGWIKDSLLQNAGSFVHC